LARDAFAAYRTEYPDGRFRDGALYWGGVAANRAGEPLRAILLWELLIDEFDTTIVVPPGWQARADGSGNLSLRLTEPSGEGDQPGKAMP